jgi:membrane peptidoglycan carboxypeptidase
MVLARQKPGHAEERFPVEKPQRVIAPETAILMRQMMEGVVLHGTGKRAILKGYTSAGKTGSAQIYDVKTHTYSHHYNASFLGFAPVANPQIVIVVTLEGTTGGTAGFGGPVAAPVFREVAMSALRMLDVPKDLPDSLIAASRGEAVDEDDLAIAGLSRPPGDAPDDEPAQKTLKNAHNADAVRSNISVAHNADAVRSNISVAHDADAVRSRSVSSVTPPPVPADSPAPAGESSASRRPFLAGPKVPDFHGMTLRAVFEESAARGLKLEVLGSGLARAQDPPPGTVLPAGASVRVQFAR